MVVNKNKWSKVEIRVNQRTTYSGCPVCTNSFLLHVLRRDIYKYKKAVTVAKVYGKSV